MEYRKELQSVLNQQFLFEATLLKNGYSKFIKPNLGIVNIETQLYIPVIRAYSGNYYKTPVFKFDKTTLLTNIKFKDIVMDHVWIPYNLIGGNTVGITKQYVGQLYTYERKNGTLYYGIKILGVPIQ